MRTKKRGQRPPALLVTLGVSNLRGGDDIIVEAKLDTGAAMSALPSTVLAMLNPLLQEPSGLADRSLETANAAQRISSGYEFPGRLTRLISKSWSR